MSQNFREDVLSKGTIWIFTNFFIHFLEIQAKFLETVEHALEGKWYKSGDDFGIMMKLIVPLNSQMYGATPEDLTGFLEGILLGLCKDPSKPGQCYDNLNGVLTSSDALIKDIVDLVSGDAAALQKIYADGLKFLNDIKGVDLSACDLEKLANDISKLNFDRLMANYFRNMVPINSALTALQSCMPNFNECGTDIGKLFRMIVGWSLN